VSATPTVDLHAHPGAFHRPRTGELPVVALEEMHAGGVDAESPPPTSAGSSG